jgi:hypothetical protein
VREAIFSLDKSPRVGVLKIFLHAFSKATSGNVLAETSEQIGQEAKSDFIKYGKLGQREFGFFGLGRLVVWLSNNKSRVLVSDRQ